MSRAGTLTVVGTGITYHAHLTIEARTEIQAADKVFYLVADSATESLIRRLNPASETLYGHYSPGKPRIASYRGMKDEILHSVRSGLAVCAVFYGHPGVFVLPAHEAIQEARAEGLAARMLPGISAEACLFADLGVDPGAVGSQSFEATDFLVYGRWFDPSSVLILWQIGAIGTTSVEDGPNRAGLHALAERLGATYGNEWGVVLYEAAQFPASEPVIERTTVGELPESAIGPLMTLFVPPNARRQPDADLLARLGLSTPRLFEEQRNRERAG